MSADIQQLIARKESIERTIAAKGEILRDNNSTMQSPLVDAEGFPRADIDIYAVRGARVRIIELRNDLKQVTDDISVALQVIYDPAKNAEPAVNGASTPDDLKPFARVDGVAPGSPATEAVSSPVIMLLVVHLNGALCSGSTKRGPDPQIWPVNTYRCWVDVTASRKGRGRKRERGSLAQLVKLTLADEDCAASSSGQLTSRRKPKDDHIYPEKVGWTRAARVRSSPL